MKEQWWFRLLQCLMIVQVASTLVSSSPASATASLSDDTISTHPAGPSHLRAERPHRHSPNNAMKHPRLEPPEKNIDKKQILALKKLFHVLKDMKNVSNSSDINTVMKSRAGYSRMFKKKKKKAVLAALLAGGSSSLSEALTEATSDINAADLLQLIEGVEDLTAFFENDSTDDDMSALLDGFGTRYFWDLLDGAFITEALESMNGNMADTISSLTETISSLGLTPLTEYLQPLIQVLEDNEFSNLLDMNTLRSYINGEAENSPVTQLVSIISPRNYEFPPMCNVSSYFSQDFETGLCIRLSDCVFFDGESFGTCALGTGSCCIFHHTCDSTTNEWISHFTHPEELSARSGMGGCRTTVEPRHGNVCQYKLEFINFKTVGPNSNSVCEYDFLEVFGGNPVPKVCGDLTGQHMYVDVKPGGFIQVSVYTSSTVSMSRSWNIKITQINCDSNERVPAGCLQFYNETEGRVMSFNRRPDSSPRNSDMYQVGNTNYGVCVQPAPDHCAILWEEATDYGFSVSGDGIHHQLVTGPVNCTGDHIIIPGGVYRDPATKLLREDTRFCGTKLPKVLTSRQPYIVRVVTDRTERHDRSNAGFDLTYRQIRCKDN